MNTNKKVCVVGAGNWGRNHIRTLDRLGHLGGIVEIDHERRRSIESTYPQIPIYLDLSSALEAGYDGFTVATPAESHYVVARELLEHGEHVLVEKPLALSVEEATELQSLAQRQGVNLMVGHVLLFHPAVVKIKELITGGRIGKLQYLYSNRLNLGTVRKEENILWSFAPHDISIFQYFIENNPLEVLSQGGAFLQTGIHDTTLTILTYPDNIVGHIFVSWLHPFKEHRLMVIGSEGMISFEDSTNGKQLLFYEKGIDWVHGEPIKRDGPTEVVPYGKELPLTRELVYFVEHLDGTPIEIADSQNGIDVLSILEQASENLLKRTHNSKIN